MTFSSERAKAATTATFEALAFSGLALIVAASADRKTSPEQAPGHSRKLMHLDVDIGPGSARVSRAGSGVPPEPSEPLSARRREQHAGRGRSPDPFAAKPEQAPGYRTQGE
ncbi:MAG: hypothetical protein ABIO94_02595 [Opitutaceae bacterium]